MTIEETLGLSVGALTFYGRAEEDEAAKDT